MDLSSDGTRSLYTNIVCKFYIIICLINYGIVYTHCHGK
jgi:hypothetical protein